MVTSWKHVWSLIEDVSPATFRARLASHGVSGLLSPPSSTELIEASRDCYDDQISEALWAASRSVLERERDGAESEMVARILDREIALQDRLRPAAERRLSAAS